MEALPNYMAIGMSPEEFWHGPSYLCKAYRDAWKTRRDNLDTEMWVMGYYHHQAVLRALQAFDGQAEPWMERPLHEDGRADGGNAAGNSSALAFMEAYATRHNAARHVKEKQAGIERMGTAVSNDD